MSAPDIRLDGEALRANAAAFATFGAPVAAVVKNDGYGWGASRLARELDGVVESYVVADLDELAALRPATKKPIRLLADAPEGWLERVLELGGVPNVSSRRALEEATAAARRRGGLTVRIGILDAAAWQAIRPDDAPAFAAAAAGSGVRVELWTHVTSSQRSPEILSGLAHARRAFETAGVSVVSMDAASTASAGRETAFDRVRIGVGLFGARLGARVRTTCALRVTAPVARSVPPGRAGWAGYGATRIKPDQAVVVLRCGYGDGYPKAFANGADIVSVGMQYTTRLVREGTDARILISVADDLDELSARAGISPHELVVGLACR